MIMFLLEILKAFQEENCRSSDDTGHEDKEGNSDALQVHTVERVQILAFRRFRTPCQQFASHDPRLPQFPKPA